MLLAWDEVSSHIETNATTPFSQHQNRNLLGGISDPPKLANPKIIVGQSEGLGR
jgi:hypothetical protein